MNIFQIILLSIGLLIIRPLTGEAQDIDPASDPDVQPGSFTTVNGYRLAWSDEFNGTTLDETKWKYREGDDSRTFIKSYQSASNNAVSGGLYRCLLKKETMGTKAFTAGGIVSRDTMRYGYYESRFKCPPTGGWHTSFWMNTPSGSPSIEIDVFENDSINLNHYGANLHQNKPEPKKHFPHPVSTPDLNADFHVLGCEFTSDVLRYFFNGTMVYELDAAQVPHSDQQIWLTSIGLVYDNQVPIDESQLPVEAQYDYIRFFELGPYATAQITSPAADATISDTNTVVQLAAGIETYNTNAAPQILWSKWSGPGEVWFSDPASAYTGARFPADGVYEIACSAILNGVTNSDSITLSVNASQIVSFQHGVDGYDSDCTFIRKDLPNRNNGADDEIIVGNWGGGVRGLMRFDLSGLDPDAVIQDIELELYHYGGNGTVGTMELHELSASFIEGTGDGTSDSNGAGSGATWYQRTGSNGAVIVSTSVGSLANLTPISQAIGVSGTDYCYLSSGTDPGSPDGVLTDNRFDTGLMNVPDDTEFHFGEVLSDFHVITVLYNASSSETYYDQPQSITAYSSAGVQIGNSILIPDFSTSSFDSWTLSRPNSTTLTDRGMYGFTVSVLGFGGVSSDIAYVKMSSTPNAHAVDIHYVGSAPADDTFAYSGVKAITSVGTAGTAPENWNTAGGDFSAVVLSEYPGFDATVPGYKSFPSSTEFVSAAQAAMDAGQPLNLIIFSPETEAGPNQQIARFRSDDASSALECPKLILRYMGSYLPEVFAGPSLAGMTNRPIVLKGTENYADTVEWSSIGDSGSVIFSDSTALTNSAEFVTPGRHRLRLSGSNPLGTAWQDLDVSIVDDLPVLNGAELVDETYRFEISAVTGLDYTIQLSTNLTTDSWMDLYTTNIGIDPIFIDVPFSTNSSGYYRLMLEP